MAAAAGCVGGGPASEWTRVSTEVQSGFGIQIQAADRDRLVAIRPLEQDAAVEMIDGDGRTVWSRTIAATDGTAHPYTLAVGDDGMTYVGGYFAGMVDFGGDALLSTQDCDGQGGTCTEAFMAAYDGAGELRWVWHTPGTVFGYVSHVAAVPGGVALVGGGWSPPPTPAPDEIAAPRPLSDQLLLRLDSTGKELWRYRDAFAVDQSTSYTTTYLEDIVIDDQGGLLLLVGYEVDTPDRLRIYHALVELTADGQEVLRRDVDGARLALAENGDVIVAGQFQSASVEQVDSYFLYAHRYNRATGERLWSSFLGDWRWARAYVRDMAIDKAGDLVILGGVSEPGPLTVGQSALEVAGASDLFIVRLGGDDGEALTGATFGFAGADLGSSLVVVDRDDMIIAGVFNGELRIGDETYVSSPAGGVFIRRGDPFVTPPPFASGSTQ